jgi:hypothetical protein
MGGLGSGRIASGKKDNQRLTQSEREERNRVRARERWQRLKDEKENGKDLSGYQKYKQQYRLTYHLSEERLGHLRENGRSFSSEEDPMEWIKYIREKNKAKLDEILNDPEAMERIFADRDDISEIQRNAQRQKNYISQKEIKEIERKLEEEFNIVEDRNPNKYSTFKPITDDRN